MMRLDPDLCFLARCGPPDSSEIEGELKSVINPDPMDDDEDRYVATTREVASSKRAVK